MNSRESWWEEAVRFHGHSCPGLAIGVRLALDFREDLGLLRAEDEELVVVAETDACGVDGFQVVLGCTAGKGNLWVFKRGKHAFTLYSRTDPGGRRYFWHGTGLPGQSRPEKIRHYLTSPREDLYTQGLARVSLPPEATLWPSRNCQGCGESTAEPNLRVRDGQTLCLDCAGIPLETAWKSHC